MKNPNNNNKIIKNKTKNTQQANKYDGKTI